MAKLRMTYKNLKALRKTKEYQALLVDLVANNIVPKSVAENLLGYNIPANLIGGAESGNEEGPTVTEPEETGNEQGSGSGTEGSGTEEGNTVTLLYFDAAANNNAGEWKTATYTLTGEDTDADILAAAQEAFGDFVPNGLNQCTVVVENQAYNPDGMSLGSLYVALDPQPEAFVKGQLVKVFYESVDEGGSTPK